MNIKNTFEKSLISAWMILKFIVPIYLLADLLYYYEVLSYLSFLLEPITAIIGLPPEAALALISGMFLNLYAGIAFAAPLDMSVQQWTVLAVFLGIAHSLIVESAVMKQLGLSSKYAYGLRIVVAIAVGVLVSHMPQGWFSNSSPASELLQHAGYPDVWSMLIHSLQGALILTLKIVALITVLIFFMEWIKSLPLLQKSAKHVSKGFTLASGLILGITYGAGVLISEAKSGDMSKNEIMIIGTFLLICHAIIEDTLLFMMSGADGLIIVIMRILPAIVVAGLAWWILVVRKA